MVVAAAVVAAAAGPVNTDVRTATFVIVAAQLKETIVQHRATGPSK